MFCGQTMTRTQCLDSVLRLQSRALFIAGTLSFSQIAWAQIDTDNCIVSEIQPDAIDLDQPRDQLARQSDLDIPAGARIGRINIIRRPIFDTTDPEQDNFLYRTLNALNTPTWKSALRAQLVFDEGDVYQPGTLDESERILRQSEYLTAAWIGVTRVAGMSWKSLSLHVTPGRYCRALVLPGREARIKPTPAFLIRISWVPARAWGSPTKKMPTAARPVSISMIRTCLAPIGRQAFPTISAVMGAVAVRTLTSILQ